MTAERQEQKIATNNFFELDAPLVSKLPEVNYFPQREQKNTVLCGIIIFNNNNVGEESF